MPDTGAATIVARCDALSDPTRWAVLELVGERARSATEIAQLRTESRQAISRHLAVLAEVGLVETERRGRAVLHRAVGGQLSALGHDLDTIGRAWEARLGRLALMAEEAEGGRE